MLVVSFTDLSSGTVYRVQGSRQEVPRLQQAGLRHPNQHRCDDVANNQPDVDFEFGKGFPLVGDLANLNLEVG